MKRKLMITALAAVLSLGANASIIEWSMIDWMIDDLQDIPSNEGFSGDGNVILMLLDPTSLGAWDVCCYMDSNGITSFNDVNIQASILGVWEADIFNVTTDSVFSTGNLSGRTVGSAQAVVLFLGSDTSNANYYLTVSGDTMSGITVGGDIITSLYDPDIGLYSFHYIPEPGTGLLALAGASALLLRRRRRRMTE